MKVTTPDTFRNDLAMLLRDVPPQYGRAPDRIRRGPVERRPGGIRLSA